MVWSGSDSLWVSAGLLGRGCGAWRGIGSRGGRVASSSKTGETRVGNQHGCLWRGAKAGRTLPGSDVRHRFKQLVCLFGFPRLTLSEVAQDLNSAITLLRDCLASPNSILVFSPKNRGLSTPENPDAIDRFSTNTVLAWSTLMIGMP